MSFNPSLTKKRDFAATENYLSPSYLKPRTIQNKDTISIELTSVADLETKPVDSEEDSSESKELNEFFRAIKQPAEFSKIILDVNELRKEVKNILSEDADCFLGKEYTLKLGENNLNFLIKNILEEGVTNKRKKKDEVLPCRILKSHRNFQFTLHNNIKNKVVLASASQPISNVEFEVEEILSSTREEAYVSVKDIQEEVANKHSRLIPKQKIVIEINSKRYSLKIDHIDPPQNPSMYAVYRTFLKNTPFTVRTSDKSELTLVDTSIPCELSLPTIVVDKLFCDFCENAYTCHSCKLPSFSLDKRELKEIVFRKFRDQVFKNQTALIKCQDTDDDTQVVQVKAKQFNFQRIYLHRNIAIWQKSILQKQKFILSLKTQKLL